jgi:hypothetical protein
VKKFRGKTYIHPQNGISLSFKIEQNKKCDLHPFEVKVGSGCIIATYYF